MKITWVNHASFIVEYDGVKLMTDPWIEGAAFDNGWALLSKSVFRYEDFNNITHIWFSHEHPDHFSPPVLNRISKEAKSKITVLFQATVDRKVVDFCKKAGFKSVVDMNNNKYYSLSPKIECLCNSFTDGDSWLYIKTDKCSLLNVNDCVVNTLKSANDIKEKIGNVDILLTQFGYANKVGDTDDVEKRKIASAEKLKRVELQQSVFKATTIIPFASYVYFCHEENKYMNKGINRIDNVYDFINKKLAQNCIVLYPGDEWEVGTNHNSTISINKYLKDYSKVENNEVDYIQSSNSKSLEEMKEAATVFITKILTFNKGYILYKFFPSAKIWINNYNKAYSFNFRNGLNEISKKKENCDIAISADALFYAFKFLWGGDTLWINARYQTPPYGNYLRFRAYLYLASLANRGKKISIKNSVMQFLRLIWN